MKRYIRSNTWNVPKTTVKQVLDEAAQNCIDEFASYGFEMELWAYRNGYVVLKVVSIDGDPEKVLHSNDNITGSPRIGDYALFRIGYSSPDSFDFDGNIINIDAKIESSVVEYVNEWRQAYDNLSKSVDKIEEINTQLPHISADFVAKHADEFPELVVNITIRDKGHGQEDCIVLETADINKIWLTVEGTIANEKFIYIDDWKNWESGAGEVRLVKEISDILRRKARGSGNQVITKILKDHGIDTTKAKYELVAEKYDRYGSGRRYKKTFSCPGDYLSYFAMATHATPNYSNIEERFGDIDEFEGIVNRCPSIDSIYKLASSTWYGDGDDYIISLKNLTTGEILYQSEELE